MRSYIIRVYREADPAEKSVLVGVVENARAEQRRFHGIEELARILEQDRDAGDASVSAEHSSE